MIEPGLAVVLLAVLIVVYVRARRRRPAGRVDTGLFVIAALATLAPVIIRLFTVDVTVMHALWVVPMCTYVLYGLYRLIRDRREIAAGWRAETEDDRKRGLR